MLSLSIVNRFVFFLSAPDTRVLPLFSFTASSIERSLILTAPRLAISSILIRVWILLLLRMISPTSSAETASGPQPKEVICTNWAL